MVMQDVCGGILVEGCRALDLFPYLDTISGVWTNVTAPSSFEFKIQWTSTNDWGIYVSFIAYIECLHVFSVFLYLICVKNLHS